MTRDRDTIDQELRLIAAVRNATRGLGGTPTTDLADDLLDERAGLRTVEAADSGSSAGQLPPTPGY